MRKRDIAACIAGLVVMAGMAFADVRQEAMDSLDTAKGFLSKKDYSKAVEEINYALSKISEIQAERLIAFIPDAPKGFTLEEKSSQGMGQAGAILGSPGGVVAEARYTGPEAESKGGELGYDDEDSEGSYGTPYVNLKISVGGILGAAGKMASFANMFGGAAGTGVKSVRIAGYTGTLEFDKENRSGTLTMQVGDKITVTAEGSYIMSADVLQEVVKSMKLKELEGSF